MGDNQGEVEKYRAAVKGEVADATVELVVHSAQAIQGRTKLLFAVSGIRAKKLFVNPFIPRTPPRVLPPDFFKHFVGEHAPDHLEAHGQGLLASPDYPLLYKDTTNYTFTADLTNGLPGTHAAVADRIFYHVTIQFKDDSEKVLGTWTGTYYEVVDIWKRLHHEPIFTFSGPGRWTSSKDEDEGVIYTGE